MNKIKLALGCMFAMAIITPSVGIAQQGYTYPAQGDAYTAPGYKFLRYQEDWSSLKTRPENERGYKFVPLNEDGSYWASFGGHARYRFESFSNFAFGAPADNDDQFSLWRATLHSDLHFGDSLRFFGEIKTANGTSRDLPNGPGSTGLRNLDRDTLALQQAFIDIKQNLSSETNLTWRLGRQELAFGKQRLVSSLPWSNTLRTWDGLRAIAKSGSWNVSAFYTQFVPVRQSEFNIRDDDQEFYGFNATHTLGTASGYDAYWFSSNRAQVAFNGTSGRESRETLGARLWNKKWLGGAFDYDVEAAYQIGDVGTEDVDAYMLALEVGYKPKTSYELRWFFGFDYASGDDEAGGEVNTFIAPFPLGHAYLGFIDIIGRQNIIDVSGGASFKVRPKVWVRVALHNFLLENENDGLYNAGGGLVRAAPVNNNEDDVGQELDITLTYKINRHWKTNFGVTRFFAGDFISDTGTDEDTTFIYGLVNVNF